VEHHELLLAPGRNDDGSLPIIQQISFRCATLKDVKDFYQTFVDHNVPIQRVVSHGNTVSVYARDPDNNSVEVYWPSGIDMPQPFGKPMDLTKSEPEIRDQLTQIIREWEDSKQKQKPTE
jgi:hypothetical protein